MRKGRQQPQKPSGTKAKVQKKSLELIATDKYDVISIHTFDYDDAAHAYGPESREALNAVALEAEA